MKIYFAGSITGGRQKVQDYGKIVEVLEEYGEVLTKEVANPNVSQKGENLTPEQVHTKDTKWLKECDIVVAEITIPSLGVGYELAYAESQKKKVICMYEEGKIVSSLVRGNPNFYYLPYTNLEKALVELKEILRKQ